MPWAGRLLQGLWGIGGMVVMNATIAGILVG
jgi:hypothetical protein